MFFSGKNVPQLYLLHILYSIRIICSLQNLKHYYIMLYGLTSVSRSPYMSEGDKMQWIKKTSPLGTSTSL